MVQQSLNFILHLKRKWALMVEILGDGSLYNSIADNWQYSKLLQEIYNTEQQTTTANKQTSKQRS